MIWQAILYIWVSFLGWVFSMEIPEAFWDVMALVYGAIAVVGSWLPPVPYVPYRALSQMIGLVGAVWISLLVIAVILRIAKMLRITGGQ